MFAKEYVFKPQGDNYTSRVILFTLSLFIFSFGAIMEIHTFTNTRLSISKLKELKRISFNKSLPIKGIFAVVIFLYLISSTCFTTSLKTFFEAKVFVKASINQVVFQMFSSL
ncbi:unnamed protein product [Mucor hiemalis]